MFLFIILIFKFLIQVKRYLANYAHNLSSFDQTLFQVFSPPLVNCFLLDNQFNFLRLSNIQLIIKFVVVWW